MSDKWIWKIKTELTEVELDKQKVLWEDDKEILEKNNR